jgi:hypothetical protein
MAEAAGGDPRAVSGQHVRPRAGAAAETTFETLEVRPDALGGAATMKRVAVVQPGKCEQHHRFELTVYIPNAGPDKPRPAFCSSTTATRRRPAALTTPTQPTTQPSEYWPVEQMIGRGYAMASFKNGEVAPDDPQHFRDGAMRLFEQDNAPTSQPADSWGAARRLGVGCEPCDGLFETDQRIDAKHVGVVGPLARPAKAAVWAGATDTPLRPGRLQQLRCGGAAIERRRFGETIAIITQKFPHWFAPASRSSPTAENEMPFDSHMLLSLIAPRALYVTSSADDLWADPRGEFLGLVHSSPAYALCSAPRRSPTT